MKKKLLILSIIILVLAGIVTSFILISKNHTPVYSSSNSSKRLPENMDTILANDLIFIGEALDDVTQENTVINYIDKYNGDRHLYRNFYTDRNIKIIKIIKGEYSNNTIQA